MFYLCYLRNNSTEFKELEVLNMDLMVASAVLLRCEAEPVKRIFVTVKSTTDTDNSSNTVLLFLLL